MLTVVRHGETVWNKEGRFQGQQDSPLTAAGRVQAKRTAGKLKATQFRALYSSDLGRALESARFINTECNLMIIPDPRLRERHAGVLEGLNFREIKERHDDINNRYYADENFRLPGGGESQSDVLARITSFLQDLVRTYRAGHVLVVTHGGVLTALLRWVLQIPLTAPRRYHLPNAAVNTFVYEPPFWFARLFGDTSHLEDGSTDRLFWEA